MSPYVKYTLGRIGIFVAALALVWFFPIDTLVKLMVALVVSMIASYFLLGKWRMEIAERMATTVDKRREEKERLRSALAGDDEPAPATRETTD